MKLPSFKSYKSNPIVRRAYQIKPSDIVKILPDKVHLMIIDGVEVSFVAHQPINIGDYIIFLNDIDIYHCNRAVFLERNIVNET